MGKIVSNFFIALDDVVEAPDQWHFPYFNDEIGAAIGRGTEGSEGFLMGRVLYEEWADYWPNQGDEEPFASFQQRVQVRRVEHEPRPPGATPRSCPAMSPLASGRSRPGPRVTSACPGAPPSCGGSTSWSTYVPEG